MRRPLQPQVKNSKRHTFKYYAPSYWSLSKGALQCLKAAHLKGKHLSLLQNLLGPAEALAQHGTKHDMALLMELQGILFHYMEVGDPVDLVPTHADGFWDHIPSQREGA